MKILMTLLMLLSFNFALAEDDGENTFCNEQRNVGKEIEANDEQECTDKKGSWSNGKCTEVSNE